MKLEKYYECQLGMFNFQEVLLVLFNDKTVLFSQFVDALKFFYQKNSCVYSIEKKQNDVEWFLLAIDIKKEVQECHNNEWH